MLLLLMTLWRLTIRLTKNKRKVVSRTWLWLRRAEIIPSGDDAPSTILLPFCFSRTYFLYLVTIFIRSYYFFILWLPLCLTSVCLCPLFSFTSVMIWVFHCVKNSTCGCLEILMWRAEDNSVTKHRWFRKMVCTLDHLKLFTLASFYSKDYI